MDSKTAIVPSGEGESLDVLGCQIRFMCLGDRTARAWSLLECTAPRDCGPPPHHHAWDEAYYIVEGEARFIVDGREIPVKAGDFLHVRGGTVHGFAGTSATPCRMLIFDAPAHAEGFFREAAQEVRSIPNDLPKVPGIGERHGIHFLPPP